MNRNLLLQSIATAVLTAPVCFGTAVAANPPLRTYVASYGSDLAPCSRVSPCRSLDAAIDAVASGGLVAVLDSAGFAPVTIAKPVQVMAPTGVEASIDATSGHAITVSVGNWGRVVLRGLNITMHGPYNAIEVTGSPDLYIENCVLNGFQTGAMSNPGLGRGINSIDNTMSPNIYVHDSIVRNFSYGMSLQSASPSAGKLLATVTRSEFHYNIVGVHVGSGATATVRDSTISANGTGFDVSGNGTAWAAVLTLEENAVTMNDNGIIVTGAVTGGMARAYLGNNTITSNAASGLTVSGAAADPVVVTRGNNTIRDNGQGDIRTIGGASAPVSYAGN